MAGAVVAITTILGAAAAVIVPIIVTIVAYASTALAAIGASLASITAALSQVLVVAIDSVTLAIRGIVFEISTVLNPLVTDLIVAVKAVTDPIFIPLKAALESINASLESLSAAVDSVLTPMAELRELIISVSSLKIIMDMFTGLGDLKRVENASIQQVFDTLSGNIRTLATTMVTTTVNMMDKVDTEVRLLGASIDTFDERLKMSLEEASAITKAELLTIVTPRLDVLGRHQQEAIRVVARISRHIEDEHWFGVMFLRMLR